MENIVLILIWVIVAITLWLPTTILNIENKLHKHLEFTFKTISYILVVIISFLIGILIK